MVKEGQSLSAALATTKIFPGLSIDMIEVGESTGALPAMLASVAEFYEDDVEHPHDRRAVADRAGHHDFHGLLRSFVLVALYLPIFSLADIYDED